jgi:hypothetical protein
MSAVISDAAQGITATRTATGIAIRQDDAEVLLTDDALSRLAALSGHRRRPAIRRYAPTACDA